MSRNIATLKSLLNVCQSSSLKVVPFDRLGMVSYKCFMVTFPQNAPFLRYSTSKNVVTFKSASKVTQGHRNWQWSIYLIDLRTYDFLLTFHSNQRPIWYCFRDKGWLLSKIANSPMYCAFPLKEFPLEFGIAAWSQKTRVIGLSGRTRSLTISSAMWIQCTNVTDRRTDRRTPDDSKDCA